MITFNDLHTLSERPELFSAYTAETLWADPHISQKMLEIHLSQDTSLASRPAKAIERVVDWIDEAFGLKGRAVCDIGCGPGLYANKFVERGALVHGLDFSTRSLHYAQEHAPSGPGSATFALANYLEDPLPPQQDLITLIYCDLCPLSPDQRQTLLTKVLHALSPGGVFLFDVYSDQAFKSVREGMVLERNLMDGFWSKDDYFAIHQTFRYDEDKTSLDRFTIVENGRNWDVFNWLKHFSKEEITRELEEAGFINILFTEGFDIDPNDPSTFGIVASAP